MARRRHRSSSRCWPSASASDPPGWEAAAGVFADAEPRTIADCHDPESLARVREWKRIQREAKKDKQGRDLPQRAG